MDKLDNFIFNCILINSRNKQSGGTSYKNTNYHHRYHNYFYCFFCCSYHNLILAQNDLERSTCQFQGGAILETALFWGKWSNLDQDYSFFVTKDNKSTLLASLLKRIKSKTPATKRPITIPHHIPTPPNLNLNANK